MNSMYDINPWKAKNYSFGVGEGEKVLDITMVCGPSKGHITQTDVQCI